MKLVAASIEDLLAAASAPLARRVVERLAALVRHGAFALYGGEGQLIALGGLYAYPDGAAREAWIRIEPGSWSRLRPLLAAARSVLAIMQDGAPIVARIRAGNDAGERLARLLGFRPTGELSAGQPVWRFEMTTAVKNLFGNGDIEEQRAAQRRQEGLVTAERAKLDEVEAGQVRARDSGRGLLAFVNESGDLADQLGGVARRGQMRKLGGAA